MESKDQSKQSMNQILLTPWKIKKYEKLIECNHSISGGILRIAFFCI